MANSFSNSISPPSDGDEFHDNSLLSSVLLRRKNPIPRPNNNADQPEQGDPPAASQSNGLAGSSGPTEPIPPPPAPVEPVTRPRPRGRPKGSKNKPKYAEPPMRVHLLEVQPGSDIMEAVRSFARAQDAGVSVVNGSGWVRDPTVRAEDPDKPPHSVEGPHEVRVLTGFHVGPARVRRMDQPGPPMYQQYSGPQPSYMMLELVGARGVCFGGMVTGELIAASSVLLNVYTFVSYDFHRVGNVFDNGGFGGGGFDDGASGSTADGGSSGGAGPSTSRRGGGYDWEGSVAKRARRF